MYFSRLPSDHPAARMDWGELSAGLQNFAQDVQTLSLLWPRNFTVMVSGFTFTACSKSREIEISRPYVKRDGNLGFHHLGVLAWSKSGEIRMQWHLTAPSIA